MRAFNAAASSSGSCAQIPIEDAFAGDDVDRGAAGDRADGERRVRRVETAFGPGARRAPRRASRPISAMISAAAEIALTPRSGALECPSLPDRCGCGRTRSPFAHWRSASRSARRRSPAAAARCRLGQRLDQRRRAEAAGLLVMGEGEMQRHRERPARHLRHQRQDERDKALHIGAAAAVEPRRRALGQARTGRCAIPGRRPARHRCGPTG